MLVPESTFCQVPPGRPPGASGVDLCPGAVQPDYAGGVIEIEDVPQLRSPVLVAAFEGWNDAADAASSVVDHLARVWNARTVAAIDPEDFYDFQVNRPLVGTDETGCAGSPGRPPSCRSARPPARCGT